MYGYFKLLPYQVEDLSLHEISEMIIGAQSWIDNELDRVMQITAWQTALIMTSSGNYKNGVKPEKLYEPLEKRKTRKNKANSRVDINKKREELKKLFGLNEDGEVLGLNP